ncbi:hypothetical protein N7530_007835 [Penicillium desertorum]|uniref:Uncharacterized protein n=1 Tax=Penicillium desertorum TaxID=1303715 RepID=A0A9W9WNL3_9EURO|nr:hypothetical protein N7530_007835 [Penicillium desertorum]
MTPLDTQRPGGEHHPVSFFPISGCALTPKEKPLLGPQHSASLACVNDGVNPGFRRIVAYWPGEGGPSDPELAGPQASGGVVSHLHEDFAVVGRVAYFVVEA